MKKILIFLGILFLTGITVVEGKKVPIKLGIIVVSIVIIRYIWNNKKLNQEESLQEYNMNDEFYELYEKMGFVNDMDKNKQYPYLLESYEEDRITIYKFLSNKNKINEFIKNKELIEEYVQDITSKYTEVLEITRNEKDKRIIEVKIIHEQLEKFYILTTKLIPKQDEILVGKSVEGDVTFSWDKIPHLFIAGETGGGKTVAIKNIIIQTLYQSIEHEPVSIYLADYKLAIDYMCFTNIFEVIEDRKRLSDLTEQLIDEVNRRGKLLKASGFENLKEYNINAEVNNLPKMHRIILVIDELVECLSGKKKDEKYIEHISENLETLARLSRALGVHIIAGTQLPTVKDIGSSQFKNNIPGRLCGKFADESASRVVLSSNIATKLPDIQGRMIFKKGANYLEIQTPLCNSQMVKAYINQYGNQFKLIDNLKKPKNKENIKTLSEMKKEHKRDFEKLKDEKDKLSENNG